MSHNPIFESFSRGLAPNPYITIDEWADTYRQLPKGASAEAGQYSTERMPYLREIMHELSPQSPTQQVKVIKGTQLGLTEVGNNVAMYYMDVAPSSQLMILPTETLAKDHSSSKLTPSIRAMPYLAEQITGGKTKDDIGGTFEKIYPGGKLRIGWSFSPANFRSLSCRVVILDDVDGFPADVGGEGDPLELGKKRADAFGSQAKIYINSTPTVEGASNIEAEFEASDQRHYYMPCPHCGEMISFERDGFILHYDEDTYQLTENVQYGCTVNGCVIDEHHKTNMMRDGKWIAHNQGHMHRGYRIPAYYSPIGFLSWNKLFSEFLEAKRLMNRGDTRKMKTWTNTRDAKTWADEVDTVNVDNLPGRCEPYEAEVPDGVLILAAGVDTQNDRFEVEVVGTGVADETWSIDYHIIHGDPNEVETRQALAAYLGRTFECHDGARMKIFATAVDTGGHRTTAAYKFCKPRFSQRVFAIKGSSTVSAPFVTKRASKSNKGGVNLYMIGVNAGKDEIYANLEITEPGPNYMHFPDKEIYDNDYFNGLTAERRDKKTGGWVKFRQRNEPVDVRNYANAARLLAGIDDDVLSEMHETGRRIGVVTEEASAKPRQHTERRLPRSHLDEF